MICGFVVEMHSEGRGHEKASSIVSNPRVSHLHCEHRAGTGHISMTHFLATSFM